MELRLAVNPATGGLNGRVQGSIQEGTQHARTFTANASGHTHSTGFGPITSVGAVNGQAVVSVPPPAIGTYLAPFTASFSVDNDWSGSGRFTVGQDTYQCKVSKVS
jgi:hypothetical protein